MGPTHPLITIGTASQYVQPAGATGALSPYDADLGKTVLQNGKWYRLVKAGAAISAAASSVLVTAVSSGAPTWVVNTTTTASDYLVAGVVPAGQVGSTGTTGLVSGDYFYIQISGPSKVKVHTTATAAGTSIVTATTAGTGDAVSATYAATTHGAIFAVTLEASSGADGITDCKLVGLI